jgi:hypothetical protein
MPDLIVTALDVLVVSCLGVLYVATTLHNAGRKVPLPPVLHRVGLVPEWTFFAPTPGVQNLYLLYRDVHFGAETTAWRVVHQMDVNRGWWTFAWNPRRRQWKALHDLITSLEKERSASRPEMVQLSMPYLLMLHHLSRLPRIDGVWASEFIIMVSNPNERPRVAYQSGRHPL